METELKPTLFIYVTWLVYSDRLCFFCFSSDRSAPGSVDKFFRKNVGVSVDTIIIVVIIILVIFPLIFLKKSACSKRKTHGTLRRNQQFQDVSPY